MAERMWIQRIVFAVLGFAVGGLIGYGMGQRDERAAWYQPDPSKPSIVVCVEPDGSVVPCREP